MKTKKIPIFYICLIVISVIVIVLTLVAKEYLKGVLAEYEDSQYKYVAENFFESNFAVGNGETFAELFATQKPELETEENFREYLSRLTDGKSFSLQHASSGTSEEEKYNVVFDDTKFASFSVVKSGAKSKYGFDLYRPSDVVFNENLFETYYFQIPEGYSLSVNGVEIGEEYISEVFEINISETESAKFAAYSISNLCNTPICEVKTQNDEICEVNVNDTGVFYVDYSFEKADNDTDVTEGPTKEFSDEVAKQKGEALAAEYTDYIITATQLYARYMQDDATFRDLSPYLDSRSVLYTNLKNTQHQWTVIDHFSYWFEDTSVSDFYAYSDDIFSCRISTTHVLRYKENSGNTSADIIKDRKDYIDITWYLHKVDGKYLIYDSFTN